MSCPDSDRGVNGAGSRFHCFYSRYSNKISSLAASAHLKNARHFATLALALFIAIALTMLSDSVPSKHGPWLSTNQVIEAQSSEPTATCMKLDLSTSPLHGRTKLVVDRIMHNFPSYTNLILGPQCERVTAEDLKTVTTLGIASGNLSALRAGDFAGMPNLETINLERNRLTWMHKDTFKGLSNLKHLHLQTQKDTNNNVYTLTSLHADIFDGLSSLQTLRLDDNGLTSLDEDIFDGLSSLQTLRLEMNQLTSLHEDTFDGLSNLQTLLLYDNNLTSLPENVFYGLSNLQMLRLDQNPNLISPEPSFFLDQFLNSLTELRLGSGVPNAQELASYKAVISTLTTLRLDVEDAATTCGTSPLQGRTKKVADVIASSASKACSAVTASDLAAITSLNISSQGLIMLRADDFDGLTNLRTLDISSNIYDGDPSNDNRLETLPEGIFEGLSSLRTLVLNENWLESLPADIFDGLSSLRWLYLGSNRLESLPADIFDGLSNLQRLRLDWNRLSSLHPDTFHGLSSLQWLYLYRNQLTSLSAGTFNELSSLIRLRMQDNS